MKVKISNYSSRWISEVHTRYMNKKYGRYEWDDNKDWKDRMWERVEDALQWLYNHTINLILDKRSSQKVNVRIDYWDTWSADHTLAYIITPILKKLRESKQGAPWVDDEDVPEELRSTSSPPKENEYDLDDNHFKRWDWVLDEMIWTFEQKSRSDGWEGDYYEYEHFDPINESEDFGERIGIRLKWEDREGRKAHQERMNNGFFLFGKYYESLWN
jgi:hypothetical protein